jgi:hypothetical protein
MEQRRGLSRTVVFVVAVSAALAAGPAVAAHFTTPTTVPTQETANQREGQVTTPAAQAYVLRPAYVGGKTVLIRIRADAANVREDRGIRSLDLHAAR